MDRMDLATKLAAKLELSERKLLVEIGRNVGMYETVPPDNVAEEEGRSWFNDRYESLKQVVCVPDVQKALDRTTSDLGLALMGCLAANYGGYGVETVAALLIKKGIHGMCDWK